MEKSLIEKIEKGNCDEIDLDMITARVMIATKKLHNLFGQFGDSLKELCNEYSKELEIAGVGITCGCTDCTDKADEVGFKVVYGAKNIVEKTLVKLVEVVM